MSKPVEIDIGTADELQEAVYCAVWRVVYHAVSEVDEGVIVDRAALCEEVSSAASQAIHDAITDCDDSPWLDAERAVRPDSEGAQPTNATAP